MKDKFIFITGIMFSIFFFCWPVLNAFAGVIQGHVKDEKGKVISRAAVILFNETNKRINPEMKACDQQGEFRFNVNENNKYRLVVCTNETTWNKTIDYREQRKEIVEVEIGKKWYENKLLDKIWELIGIFLAFLAGLWTMVISERRRKSNIQKNIISIYDKSKDDFINEYNKTKNISFSDDDEKTYSTIYSKYTHLKENLQALLSYSWGVENMEPGFYMEIKQRLALIQAMENTVPFDARNKNYRQKLFFLKEHHNEEKWKESNDDEEKAEHEKFKELIEDLKKNGNGVDHIS